MHGTDRPAEQLFHGEDATSVSHRAKGWAATPLGPVGEWPVELRAAVRTVMPSRIPMLLWWGPQLVQIMLSIVEAATPRDVCRAAVEVLVASGPDLSAA